MATQRRSYFFDQLAGENNIDSLTNQGIFGAYGRNGRRFRRLRNYHLIGEGRALKRRGYRAYVTARPNGNNPIQGMRMDEWGSTRDLYVVVGGQIRRLNGTAWDNVTGTATVATGQNTHIRFTNFTDGNNNWLLGCDGESIPFAVRNGQNALRLSELSTGPLPWTLANDMPEDICEYHGYLFALNRYSLYHTAYGTLDFSQGGIIDTQRRSLGVGLAQHSRDILLVFFESGVYAMQFNPYEGVAFRTLPIEGAEGCVSKDSIITREGHTYYASHNGIYRIGDPARGAQLISDEIQDYWDSLNQQRRFQIRAVPRGSPWHEVPWLVSEGGNSEHNAALVWNDRLEAMTIFPRSPSPDTGEFNAACLYRGSDLIDRTLVGGYDGTIYEAWGTAAADSGTSDNGASIATELETGFINFGYPGVSSLREVFIDGETTQNITFQVEGEALGSRGLRKTVTLGASGVLLGVFLLSTDYLASSTITQAEFTMPLTGRAHKLRLTNTGTENPHIVTAMTLTYMLDRMRAR